MNTIPKRRKCVATQCKHKTMGNQEQGFPEEILEMVFSKLKNPQDLVNVSRASSDFERIVYTTKTSWLFTEVLPLILPDLHKKHVLTCRLVCKMWKECVSNLLNNHHDARPYNTFMDENLRPGTRIYRTSLIDKQFRSLVLSNANCQLLSYQPPGITPKEWLSRMKGHNTNPFVGNSVNIFCFDFVIGKEFWNDARTFLKKYGKFIHHFKMLFKDRNQDFVELYKTLRWALKQLPNLKTLSLAYAVDKRDNYQNPIKDLNWNKVAKTVKKFPLPALCDLRVFCVDIQGSKYLPSQQIIVDEIFACYKQQLGRVELQSRFCLERQRFSKYFRNAPNLTELHLEAAWSAEKGSCIEQFLAKVPQISSLRKLKITIMHYAFGHNIQTIMESFNKFENLKLLQFKFWASPAVGLPVTRRNPKLQLPQIKDLDIQYSVACGNYNHFYDAILCYLPCLEYLNIHHL